VDKKRKSIRLPDYDYSSAGYYFITVCCRNRENYFGDISNGKMVLSEIGKKASDFWLEIPVHFNHVKLDDFIIMPNHIHGILFLDYSDAGTRHGVSLQSTNHHNIAGSCHGMTLYQKNINLFSKPVKNSVSVIINQYKSTLKRWCNKNNFRSFQWQSRFHDHILFNENSIERAREYIRLNPGNWHFEDVHTMA
jgi:REP element-mobilizing transposase RayT